MDELRIIKNFIHTRIKDFFGLHSRHVICNIPGSYPLWECSEKLLCPNLRQDVERYVGNGKWKTSWVAREFDPCPKCDHSNCHNVGKEFHGISEGRFIVEKRH
jgi:hypothetical protein